MKLIYEKTGCTPTAFEVLSKVNNWHLVKFWFADHPPVTEWNKC